MPTYRIKKGSSKPIQAIIRVKGYPSVTKQFKNKTEAKRWAVPLEEEIRQGTYEHRKITFRQASIEYGKLHEDSKEITYLLRRLRKALGHLVLGDHKNHRYLVEYRNNRAKKVSPATINKELTFIRRVHTWCKQELGLMIDIPMVSSLKAPRGRTRRVSNNELNTLLAVCDPLMQVIVQLAVETGMRRGEIISIRKEDINLTKRTIQLHDTKNGDDRSVPLSSKSVKLLSRHINNMDSGSTIFPVSGDSITKKFHRACLQTNIRDLRFHDLRHEAVSRLFELGLNPMEVAAISGHKTLAMLQRYTHLQAEDLAQKLG